MEVNFILQGFSFLFFLKSDSVFLEIIFEISLLKFSEISNVSSNGEQFAEEEMKTFNLLSNNFLYAEYIEL